MFKGGSYLAVFCHWTLKHMDITNSNKEPFSHMYLTQKKRPGGSRPACLRHETCGARQSWIQGKR
jgi:hypothetical protein